MALKETPIVKKKFLVIPYEDRNNQEAYINYASTIEIAERQAQFQKSEFGLTCVIRKYIKKWWE